MAAFDARLAVGKTSNSMEKCNIRGSYALPLLNYAVRSADSLLQDGRPADAVGGRVNDGAPHGIPKKKGGRNV